MHQGLALYILLPTRSKKKMEYNSMSLICANKLHTNGQTKWELRGWSICYTNTRMCRWAGPYVWNASISLAALNVQLNLVFNEIRKQIIAQGYYKNTRSLINFLDVFCKQKQIFWSQVWTWCRILCIWIVQSIKRPLITNISKQSLIGMQM